METPLLDADPGTALPPPVPPIGGAPGPLRAAACGDGWVDFVRRFVLSDGRVVDAGCDGASYAESQAWTMFLAVRHGDRATFDRVRDWTWARLRRRGDALLAWRCRPQAFGEVMTDRNNATDADLYHAWALAEAASRWGDAGHLRMAREIAADILRLLVREIAGRAVLLPGADGFTGPTHADVNPSHYVFPAFDALLEAAPHPAWRRLASDGARLLAEARFGEAGLPPDWLRLSRASGTPVLLPDRPHRFGYEAICVPLHLVWGGRAMHPAVHAVAAFLAMHPAGDLPAWVRLDNGRCSTEPAGRGLKAIGDLLRAAAIGGTGCDLVGHEIAAGAAPGPHAPERFYDNALALLASEAAIDSGLATRRPVDAGAPW